MLILTATGASAAEKYTCTGVVKSSVERRKVTSQLVLKIVKGKSVSVSTNWDEDNYRLDLSSQDSRSQTFADYAYDGYGGFVELNVSQDSRIADQISARFEKKIFSEIGWVRTTTFVGTCQEIN
jgi:hypothetical protein